MKGDSYLTNLGIDVGGTNTDVVAFDGRFHHILTMRTEEFLSDPKNIEKYRNGVFAIAGWIREGKILKTPNIKNFKPELFTNLKVENDANCFAVYAQYLFKKDHIFAVTLGTGVGAGVIASGKLYRGRGLASEIGHVHIDGEEKCVCGGRGHLENFFSGWAIKKKFGREIERDEIVKFKGFEILCKEVAKAVMILDPQLVAFGGRISEKLKEEDFYLIYDYLPEEFDPEIKVIKDGLAVAKGAALLSYIEKDDPLSYKEG